MESSTETSQTRGATKPKPTPAPKPRLTPKPFSLQKNTTFRSIHAPKTVTTTSKSTTNQTGKSEATVVPKLTLTAHAQKLPQQTTTSESKPSSVSVHIKDKPTTTKESKAIPNEEDSLDSTVAPGKSDLASQTAPATETPISEPFQKDDVIQTNHKASTDFVTNSEEKDRKRKEDEAQTSVVQKPEESGSDDSFTANPTNGLGGTRKCLSTEVTSKCEPGGLSLPPKPTITLSTSSTKDDLNKPVSSDPKQSQTTIEPSNRETDEEGLKEDYSGGGSIKRRISLLFDSSLRPEVMTKREEPEIINSTRGVKERIKHWAAETSSEGPKTEKKPQVAPRPRSRSFEPATAPIAEKMPKTPHFEPPGTGKSSTQAMDPRSKVSAAEIPSESPVEPSKDVPTEKKSSKSSTETTVEDEPNKSTEGEVRLRNRRPCTTQTANDEGDSASSESAQRAPKRDSFKRRSVRFGIVERDDGGPPEILGSASESSSEEEEEGEAPEDKALEDTPVSLSVHRRVGILQKKEDEIQKQEEKQLTHLEFEQRRRAEENKPAGHKLEEERKGEEKEREKENFREREEIRLREEEKQREEERERERLKEEEMERNKKEEWERERFKEDERERKRLREEEIERERQMEVMWQRQREEERERAKQKEERLKQDRKEREKERLNEENRKEERLREEKERKRLREKEIERERQMEVIWQRQREEERERAKQKEERLKQDRKEKEKDRLNEEKMKEETLREERERKRLREEEIERERQMEVMWQRQREEERERAKQKEERLKQDQKEREKDRLNEENRKEERLREEKERKRLREEEERLIHEHEEHRLEGKLRDEGMKKEKHREEEWEKEWVKKTESLISQEEEREREKELELQRQEEEERTKRELERKMQQEKEEEMERMRQIEKQREEEEREEERKRQMEKERVEGLERKMQEALVRKQAKELEEKLRMDEEREKDELGLTNREGESAVAEAESNLISFDSDDEPQKSETLQSPLAKIHGPTETPIEVVYDDFSVRKPLIEIDFDDFSVKPKRWGSQEKAETSPVVQSWATSSVDKEDVELLVPLNVFPQENKAPEQVAKPDRPEPTPAKERPEEEQLMEEQVNSYCINGEDNDTDALIESEPDQQNGSCEQTSETDSPKPLPDQVSEVTSQDVDTCDFQREPEFPPFPESSTPLLDTSMQRSKADVGKRRIRTRPSRSLHAGLTQRESPDWRARDSTDEKEASSKQRESDSEEDQPKPKIICSPPPTSQRVPMFPGLSPAALIAQLKRRTGGGGEETEDDKGREEKGSQHEEIAPSPLSRSPRSAAHLAGAARVLPPLGGTDTGANSSPAWLKELKSKKRLSQHDSEA
ncbi:182 kDa tankyrase-1-binding protein [Xiphias gladius]|uniref:182 kDa tankyrase-1-binding protein n=1 Tax=Xiphias gladius TaxID=8245 RepID=UPI001A99BD54|nr:182 kDa tankyrase-1-binding protein [Xiphias gladius]